MKFALVSLLFLGTSAFATPGDLVALTHLTDEAGTPNVVIFARQAFCPAETALTTIYGFKRYKVDYKTTDLKGQEIVTSGLMIVPNYNGAMPLMVYQHGTVFARSELPSSNANYAEGNAIGYCYGTIGYVSILADYLGYGDSVGIHPYLHAESEAWTARDLMRAAKSAVAQLKVQLNGKIFISGYSQGGHAAMALHRLLEQDTNHEFTVTAAAPMSGPYHISAAITEVMGSPSANSTAEGAYIIVGLNQVFHLYNQLTDAFNPAYVPVIQAAFDGKHDWNYAFSAFSMKIADLFQISFLQTAIADPTSPLPTALAANDVYKWVPKAPVRLYFGEADLEVPPSNAKDAFAYMNANGANVQLVDMGASVDHTKGFPLAIGQAAQWFETLR